MCCQWSRASKPFAIWPQSRREKTNRTRRSAAITKGAFAHLREKRPGSGCVKRCSFLDTFTVSRNPPFDKGSRGSVSDPLLRQSVLGPCWQASKLVDLSGSGKRSSSSPWCGGLVERDRGEQGVAEFDRPTYSQRATMSTLFC